MKNYDELYRDSKLYWGTAPSTLVKRFAELAPPGRALDLGMGEGRDALYLARQGFDVTGVEAARSGVEKCLQFAARQKLSVTAVAADARFFKIAKNRYSLICAMNLFQFLRKAETALLVESISSGLKRGGMFICQTFSIDDPHYKARKATSQEVQPGEFLDANGRTYSLFGYGELIEICSRAQLRLINYAEYDYYDTSHGPAHWHGVIDLVARKL